MGFWNALSILAPIGPAMAEAKDIQRQKAMEDAAFKMKQDLGAAGLAEAQERLREQQLKSKQPVFLQGSQPQWNPTSHTYQQPALDPESGAVKLVDVPGVDPDLVAKKSFEESKSAYKAIMGKDPTEEMTDAMFASAYGFKAPTGSAFKPLPASAGGQPFKGPDGLYYQTGTDPSGNTVTRPMPANWQPPEKHLPINTQYVQTMGKDPNTWTDQDRQFVKGYGAYLKAQETLAGARGAAYNYSRPVQVVDPNDPTGTKTVYMPAGQAEAQGAAGTQSIAFRTQYAVQSALNRYFTSGKGGENIRTLNTAVAHLGILRDLSKALGNGDIRAWNAGRQAYARATGNPAPINFEMLRDSLAGEMARVFTGVGATQNEIAEITGPISTANSPDQLDGAITTAQAAMDSRLDALKKQYAAGLQGQPAFGGQAPATPSAGPGTPPPGAKIIKWGDIK